MNKTALLFFPTCMMVSSLVSAQTASVTASGRITGIDKTALPYAHIILKKEKDSTFTAGTITNEEGRFSLTGIKPDHYLLETLTHRISYTQSTARFIGSLSEFLEIPAIELVPQQETEKQNRGDCHYSFQKNEIDSRLDKKTYSVADNISQSGGSVLQSMQNLPELRFRTVKYN